MGEEAYRERAGGGEGDNAMLENTGIEIRADGDVIELSVEQAKAIAVSLRLLSQGTCEAHVQFCEFCPVVHCQRDSAKHIAQEYINTRP